MSNYRLCVYVLSIFVVLEVTTCDVSSAFVACKQNADCKSSLQCHTILKFCINPKSQASAASTRQQSRCHCRSNEYCHPIFVRCLPILTVPAPRNNRKPTLVRCVNDTDCQTGRYCHQQFKTCLDILAIPTLATQKSSAVTCKNDSYCTKQQYCHDFFKICLAKHTTAFNATTSQPKFVCSNNTDCQVGYYCHNMTNICFKNHGVKQLNQTKMPSPPKKPVKSSCRKDSDCRITEFCYRIFGQTSVVRHKRKCNGSLRCLQKRSHSAAGACIPRIVRFDPPSFNCSSDKDCGYGECCLKKLGVCRRIPNRGQQCVTKDADFICACSGKMYCKPNAKGKKLRGRRLEKKLKIPKYIRRLLIKKGLSYHKKHTYGRCQHVAN